MNAMVKAQAGELSIFDTMARHFGIDRRAFESTLYATVMPENSTREEAAAFLLVSHEHKLNPFTSEIFAFKDKRGVIRPVVSVDGWLKLLNSHPQFDGMDFEDTFDDAGKLLSVTCSIFRKDRSRPIRVTEYMAECKRGTDTWTNWPARMLRHKAMIQGGRYAFGFAGIMELDEAERIVADPVPRTDAQAAPIEVTVMPMPRAKGEPAQADAVETAPDAPAPKRAGKPLSPGMQKLLASACAKANITAEQLAERYPVVDTANFTAVRAELLDLSAADDAATAESTNA